MARTLPTALACVLVLLLLPACSSGADQEAAQGLASDLATALSTGQLGDVPVQGGGQEQLDTIVAGMDDIPATVTVDTVEVEGDTGTATLDWQWETPAEPWRYTTTAQLQKADDQWAVQWAPTWSSPHWPATNPLTRRRSGPSAETSSEQATSPWSPSGR